MTQLDKLHSDEGEIFNWIILAHFIVSKWNIYKSATELILYSECFSIFLSGTDHYDDPELKDLTDNFKDQAAKLVDMLDISIPVVAKLKVS